MDDIKQRVTDTAIVAQEIKDAMARLERGQNNSHATIAVNAGGVGVWIVCTLACVMLASNLFLVALYVDQQAQLRDLNAYLQAIYMQAPQLRPETKE